MGGWAGSGEQAGQQRDKLHTDQDDTAARHELDNAQRILQLSPNETAQFVFTNSVKPSLELKKLSANGLPLEGVTFRISKIEDGTHYLDRTTNAQGEILVSDLEPGVYAVQETATVADHILDSKEYRVELFAGKTSTIVIQNDKRPNLTIRKTDRATGAPLAGVTFTVQHADGATVTTEPTGADGTVTIENLLPGVYTITEQSVPEGYLLDTTPQQITLEPNRDATVQFQNDKHPTLLLKKVDMDGKPLTGAIFEVKTKAGVELGDFPVGADGTVTIDHVHLEEGYYIITEIQAPSGYILDDTPHEVYLRAGKTTELILKNEKKPGLTIIKQDSVTGEPLQGAKFELWVAKDNNPDGTFQKLEQNYYVTNATGVIELENLDTGWYKIVEVEPPSGYALQNPAEEIIYVEHDKAVEVLFENTPLSALVVYKFDSVTGEALEGAIFQVKYLGGTSGSGGTVIGTYETGVNGSFTITGLKAGTYVVEELKSPDGHVIDTAPQTVYLSGQTQDVVQLYFGNSPKGNLLIQKVDSVTKEPLSDVTFQVTTSEGTVVGNANGKFVTDSSGSIFIENLAPGTTLVVNELETKEGYELDQTPQTVTIKAGQTVTLEFRNTPNGSILITKLDSVTRKPLSGVSFEVKGCDGCSFPANSYTTDSNGQILISHVPAGSYIITETVAKEGYLLNNTSQTVKVTAGTCQEVTILNDPLGGLLIKKLDAVTKEPLSEVTFQVTTPDGTAVGNSNGEFRTDENGYISISDLEPGSYVVQEIKAKDGYVLDNTPKTIQIKDHQTYTLEFFNQPKGNLIIQKVDAITKEPLAGVTFKVTTASGELVADNEGFTSTNGLYITDENGQITLSKLNPDTYVVTEVETLDGYLLDAPPQTVVVSAADTQTLTFANTPKGCLVITKVDSVTKEPLSDVTFQIEGCNGCEYPAGTYTTDSNGQIQLNQIPSGSYSIIEVETKTGYLLDNTVKTVTVEGGTCQKVTFENDPLGGLLIKKLDAVTKEPLSEVTFRVTTPDGAAVGNSNGEFRTDENGYISIPDLKPGGYVVQEVKARDGYVLDNTPKTIQIKDHQTYTLEFFNQPKGNLIIQKVDAITKEPLAGVTFKVTTASGELVADNEGFTSTNGLYITDENGQITLSKLNPDTYVVTEVETLDGYLLDAPPQTVVVSAADTQTLTFANTPKGCLVITKVDSVTKEPLSDVTFQIEGCNGCEYPAGTYTTDSNGQIQLNQIPSGSYSIIEVETKTGYLLDNTVKTVTVEGGTCQKVTFENDPLGGLLIKKLDAVTKEPLSEVTFRVTTPDGAAVGNSNGEFRTDENGYISIPDLKPGGYVVQEVKARDGYVLDNTPKTIQIKDHQTYTLEFFNQPAGGLLIKKMDAVTKEPLSEVTFRVTTPDGTAVGNSNGEFRTDENGYISIPDLEPGSYVVQEVKAKDGYVLDNTPKTIQIKDHQTYTLEFFNQPKGNLIIHKLDSVTKTPLEGVEFEITYADGSYVDAEGGTLSSKGRYTTDENGQIILSDLTGTIVVTETKTIEGYTIHEESRSQTVVVNPHDTQELIFYNDPIGGVELIKVDEADKTRRLANATFEIRKMDDALVDTVTTDKNGRVFLSLEDGAYYAVEIEAPEGYRLDDTPHYFEVKEGKTSKLTITNKSFSGILIHKTDSTTGEGIYGVTFLLYDSGNQPIGQYTSDDRGYVYIENLESGRYYLRELENEGYLVDTQQKTVQVTSGETTLVEWENTPIMGQIQIIKKSADDNPINALPAGTLLEGAVFEIYDKAGNVVDTIVSDRNGRAVSKLLPLSRYTIREIKAPDYYAVNSTVLNAYLEYEGQILTFEVENSSVATGVSIQKTGYAEVMPNQPIQYTITEIGNTSTVPLSSFYWRDTLPSQVQLSKVVTGTFNQQLSYKIVYQTNLNGNYQTLADSLSTTKNYVLEASPAALGLAANERVTELMFIFGTVKGGFGQVEPAYIHGNVLNGLGNGTSIVNIADVGGVYDGQWIQAISRWVTKVYAKTIPSLPKTGY